MACKKRRKKFARTAVFFGKKGRFLVIFCENGPLISPGNSILILEIGGKKLNNDDAIFTEAEALAIVSHHMGGSHSDLYLYIFQALP